MDKPPPTIVRVLLVIIAVLVGVVTGLTAGILAAVGGLLMNGVVTSGGVAFAAAVTLVLGLQKALGLL